MQAQRTCSIDGCERSVRARGWCDMHYRRWKAHGDPNKRLYLRGASIEDRFWQKVTQSASCWHWQGAIIKGGYGGFKTPTGHTLAHRFSYELHNGAIPEGLQIDHLCRNRACVRPDHLEAVTQRTNILRGVGLAAKYARVTHCPKGHPYDEANTYHNRGGRYCRQCARDRYHSGKVASP